MNTGTATINWGIQGVKLGYRYPLNRGKKTSAKLTQTGSFNVYDLDPKYRTTETTAAITIVNKTIAGKGGG